MACIYHMIALESQPGFRHYCIHATITTTVSYLVYFGHQDLNLPTDRSERQCEVQNEAAEQLQHFTAADLQPQFRWQGTGLPCIQPI